MYAAADGIHIVNPATGEDTLAIAQNLGRHTAGTVYDVSPDGRFLASKLGTCWNLETRQHVPLLGHNHIDGHFVKFTPDGRHVISTVRTYGGTPEEDGE